MGFTWNLLQLWNVNQGLKCLACIFSILRLPPQLFLWLRQFFFAVANYKKFNFVHIRVISTVFQSWFSLQVKFLVWTWQTITRFVMPVYYFVDFLHVLWEKKRKESVCQIAISFRWIIGDVMRCRHFVYSYICRNLCHWLHLKWILP